MAGIFYTKLNISHEPVRMNVIRKQCFINLSELSSLPILLFRGGKLTMQNKVLTTTYNINSNVENLKALCWPGAHF